MNRKKHGKREPDAGWIIVLAVLVCTVLGALMMARSVNRQRAAVPAAAGLYTPGEPDDGSAASEVPESTAAPAPGTLLESGYGLNDHFYSQMDTQICRAVGVTDTSFTLEPAALGDSQQPVTVRYRPDTPVRIGKAWYQEDRYEIYAGTLEDFMTLKDQGYDVDVTFEDPNASELWAGIIWVHTMDIG